MMLVSSRGGKSLNFTPGGNYLTGFIRNDLYIELRINGRKEVAAFTTQF